MTAVLFVVAASLVFSAGFLTGAWWVAAHGPVSALGEKQMGDYGLVRIRFKGGRLFHRIDESRQPEDRRYVVAATLCGGSGDLVANVIRHEPVTRPACARCEALAPDTPSYSDGAA